MRQSHRLSDWTAKTLPSIGEFLFYLLYDTGRQKRTITEEKLMPKRIAIQPYDTYDISTFAIQGDIVYISHFGGSYDDEGNKLFDAEEQTLQTFRNLEKALKEIN